MEVLVRDLIGRAKELLESKGISDASIDSWILAEQVLKIDRARYYMNPEMTVSSLVAEDYMDLIQQRSKHIPLQYLTGHQQFMGLEFTVNHNVLIPRQDTEGLVEKVIEHIKGIKSDGVSQGDSQAIKVLDMCTGSGCIAISIDKMTDNCSVMAVDVSEKALDVARINNRLNGADVFFLQSDLFHKVEEKFHIIVSNPPYIRTKDICDLMPEVKDHEPVIALDGAKDGLKFYKEIIEECTNYLLENGKIFLEIGYDQAADVSDILMKNGFTDIKVYKDLSGNDRVISAGRE